MDRWPSTLQQRLNVGAFNKNYGPANISTDMDVGPAKVRSRYTKRVDTYSAEIFIDFSLIDTWETFYGQTIVNGTLPFIATDPFTETDHAFRLQPGTPPQLAPLGGRVFRLSMVWEKV